MKVEHQDFEAYYSAFVCRSGPPGKCDRGSHGQVWHNGGYADYDDGSNCIDWSPGVT
ncbi:MAG: hypothetical protein ACLT38_05280 [Akkermansia sp.]